MNNQFLQPEQVEKIDKFLQKLRNHSLTKSNPVIAETAAKPFSNLSQEEVKTGLFDVYWELKEAINTHEMANEFTKASLLYSLSYELDAIELEIFPRQPEATPTLATQAKNFLASIAPDAIDFAFSLLKLFAYGLILAYFGIYLTLAQATFAGFTFVALSAIAQILAKLAINKLNLNHA